MSTPMQRPKLTTTVWEDEGTLCYQVDAKSVCVARRQDNDMINGTKLLNVVGMSRGKRDGILKNEKGRVVVKVGAMHLKGVWITFTRAKDLATKFKIVDSLYPLFVEDPSVFLTVHPPPTASSASALSSNGALPIMLPSSNASARVYNNNSSNPSSFGSFSMQPWEKQQPYQSLPSITNQQDQMIIRSQQQSNNNLQSGSVSPVPGNILSSTNTNENDMYLLNNPYDYRSNNNGNRYSSSTSTTAASSYHIYSTSADNHADSTTTNTAAGSDNNHFSPYDHSSPYIQQRKLHHHSVIDHVDSKDEHHTEEEQHRRGSIDFPTSPPPEASGLGKYSSYAVGSNSTTSSWSDANSRSLTNDIDTATANTTNRKASSLGASSSLRNSNSSLMMSSGCHPLSNEIEDGEHPSEEEKPLMNKGRKRGHQQHRDKSSHIRLQQPQQQQQQRKRMKNGNDKISSP